MSAGVSACFCGLFVVFPQLLLLLLQSTNCCPAATPRQTRLVEFSDNLYIDRVDLRSLLHLLSGSGSPKVSKASARTSLITSPKARFYSVTFLSPILKRLLQHQGPADTSRLAVAGCLVRLGFSALLLCQQQAQELSEKY